MSRRRSRGGTAFGEADGAARGDEDGAEPLQAAVAPAPLRTAAALTPLRAAGLAVMLGTAMAACGDGTGPGEDVVPQALVATWVAEPACLPECGFTLAPVASPADSINITATTGLTTEITLTRTGTFRLVTRPGTTETAAVRVEPGILIVTDGAGVVDTLDYSIAGSYLQLQFRRTFSVFDFTGDGVSDPAHARGRFQRQ